MTPRTLQQTKSGTLMAFAEGLRRSCDKLRSSVALVKEAAEDGVEESCRQHIERAGALREEIYRQALALQQCRDEAEDMAPALRRQFEDRVNESRRMLEEAGQTYAALASKIAVLREEVGEELAAMGRGSQILGSYRRAADLRADEAQMQEPASV